MDIARLFSDLSVDTQQANWSPEPAFALSGWIGLVEVHKH